LFKGFFAKGLLGDHRLSFRKGCENLLAHSTGHVILWAPGIRYLSIPGVAKFVGKVFISERAEPL
jgi:hypothetical protein